VKKLLTLLALGCSLSLGVAHAATSPAQAAQQSKMTTCNADAKTQNLKGDARQTFMKTCLSGKDAATPQQTKMKTCNADAKTKNLSGDARKQFMSSCLKG
jgi:hypothetical protein